MSINIENAYIKTLKLISSKSQEYAVDDFKITYSVINDRRLNNLDNLISLLFVITCIELLVIMSFFKGAESIGSLRYYLLFLVLIWSLSPAVCLVLKINIYVKTSFLILNLLSLSTIVLASYFLIEQAEYRLLALLALAPAATLFFSGYYLIELRKNLLTVIDKTTSLKFLIFLYVNGGYGTFQYRETAHFLMVKWSNDWDFCTNAVALGGIDFPMLPDHVAGLKTNRDITLCLLLLINHWAEFSTEENTDKIFKWIDPKLTASSEFREIYFSVFQDPIKQKKFLERVEYKIQPGEKEITI